MVRKGVARVRHGGAVGVTGTPGTGKKSLSPVLASLLGKRPIDLNSLAREGAEPGGDGEYEVDVSRLRSRVLEAGFADAVVFGHLLPDVFRRGELEFVAVLRCEPSVLKRRLQARGYSGQKLVDDLEAELIGVVLDAAVRGFGEASVREYDSTSAAPEELARRIATDYLRGTRRRGPWLDWTLSYGSPARLRSLLSSAKTAAAST